jgi:hypothetical protein
MRSEGKLLTRAELAEFLTANGFPITRSTLNKWAMPSRGRNDGPEPEGYWGKHMLYSPDKALEWAKRRFRRAWRKPEAVDRRRRAPAP